MKVLVVSYVEGITEEIVEVIKNVWADVNIDIAVDTWHARYNLSKNEYDLMIIDMMAQEDNNHCVGPLLKPALDMLKFIDKSKVLNKPKKVFALFDKDETGEAGKEEVTTLGYKIADFTFASIQWRRELTEYMETK